MYNWLMKKGTDILEDINTEFSSADAELVNITYTNNSLVVNIVDWKEDNWQIVFKTVEAYKWNNVDFSKYTFEQVAIIKDSKWIKRLKENHKNPTDATEVKYSDEYDNDIQKIPLNHYVISINAVGSLQVAAASVAFIKCSN
jgi:hypothetical protein